MSTPDSREPSENLAPQDYLITPQEYLRRITAIQQAAFASLSSRDEEYAGDDGIDGILVIGSYAKSHPLFQRRMTVHNVSPKKPASDLDIYTLSTSRSVALIGELDRARPLAARLNDIDKETLSVNALRDVFYLYPDKGYYIALEAELKKLGLRTDVQHLGSLRVDADDEPLGKEIEKRVKSRDLISTAGLLFLPESAHKQHIIDSFTQGLLPTIINPSTEALRIN